MPEPQLRQRAYSLDTVCEELLYVTGPLIAGLIAQLANPAAGVAASAALVLLGTLAFVTAPPLRAGRSARSGQPKRSAGQRVALPLQPIAAAAGLGLALGALSLLVVVFAELHHQLSAVAWIEAALAAGSAVGGLLYGTLSLRTPARLRLPLLSAALAVLLALAGIAPGLLTLAAVLAMAGLFIAPALTTAYLLADEAATEANRTRIGTWVNTAFNLGSAAGTAGIGLLAGRLPIEACFALAALPLVLSAGTALRRKRAGRAVPARPAKRRLLSPR